MNVFNRYSKTQNTRKRGLFSRFARDIKLSLLLAVLAGAFPLSAQESEPSQEISAPEQEVASENEDTGAISYSLRRNKYFLESLRLRSLANLAIDEGEYEQSEHYSEEAVRYAQLSDDFIADQLRKRRATDAISAAREHLAWAEAAQAQKYYPSEYEKASEHFSTATAAQAEEDWETALENALLVGEDLAAVAAPPPEGTIPEGLPEFPAKYTVRPWDQFGDCFWNISDWFYGDYYKWPQLYEANKEKLPDPDNPDLLEVGTVIDIPELDEHPRLGMWDSGKPFKP
ncbi:MAG: LysM peptidoglycan-binding domain-containing protein [Spirochaetaceae bacterium]|jgi:hypothetical protein|nr:LysM peptidoglycan-binding domain-containing protein [Spirochaetaceae bacterium]